MVRPESGVSDGLLEPKTYQRSEGLWRRSKTRLTALVCVVAAVILALVVGLYFGLRNRSASSSSSSSSGPPPTTVEATLAGPPPPSNFQPIQPSFVSFAIEFIFFPNYAGTASSPNTFSDTLLDNIGNITGTKPYVRVGGNTQDLAIYSAQLPTPTQALFVSSPLDSHFADISIGPSFFEGFANWPGVQFIYGLNLNNATNSATGWDSLIATVEVACQALTGKLLFWEYGNEPDAYPRPESTWNDSSYADSWKNGTDAIQSQLSSSCSSMASGDAFGFVGPSLLGTTRLPPVGIFQAGYNSQGYVKEYTLHHYMDNAAMDQVSLQGTLMNHSNVIDKLSWIQQEISSLNNPPLINPDAAPETTLPFSLDEANSILQGNLAPSGTLDVFGSALWTVDYMLYCASIGLSRVHMQQGSGFLYNSWEPVGNGGDWTMGTKAPYYGNIAVATMMGNITENVPRIVEIDLSSSGVGDFASAYAAYINSNTLARVAVIDLHQYNATQSDSSNANGRGSTNYTFSVPSSLSSQIVEGASVTVQRLQAAGSDVLSGITFDGWSYDYSLDEGRPVRLNNVTTGEAVKVTGGKFTVQLAWSEAVVMSFV
ncbi:MAG: hypothetical protein MMC33_004909 [Icmadophila ericetorum]|nr:hypothetical protein [Icmadophila ericetorum]